MNQPLATEIAARRVAHRTRRHSHGAIMRLVSPSDVGELIKPFAYRLARGAVAQPVRLK